MDELERYSILDMARACHEATRGYCEAIGDPPLTPFDECGAAMQASICDGVVKLLQNTSWGPMQNHTSWTLWKAEHGWKWGAVKDTENKLHPDLVLWEALPASQRAKNAIFVGIVRSLAGQPKTNIYEAQPPSTGGIQ